MVVKCQKITAEWQQRNARENFSLMMDINLAEGCFCLRSSWSNNDRFDQLLKAK